MIELGTALLAPGVSHVEASGGGGSAIGSGIGLVIDILIAFACARIAASKGRHAVLYGVLGFFFSIITLIVVLILPRKNA